MAELCRMAPYTAANTGRDIPINIKLLRAIAGFKEASGGNRAILRQRSLTGRSLGKMAERVRFELTRPVKVCRFSRPVHSTALPPLRIFQNQLVVVPLCLATMAIDGAQCFHFAPKFLP